MKEKSMMATMSMRQTQNYMQPQINHEYYINHIQALLQELEVERAKSDRLKAGIKKISQTVIQNNELIVEVQRNKKASETLVAENQECQKALLNNFGQFKGYVEKILANLTNQLVDYNKKEAMCKEIKQENDLLRQRCRDLVDKLKYYSGQKV